MNYFLSRTGVEFPVGGVCGRSSVCENPEMLTSMVAMRINVFFIIELFYEIKFEILLQI